MLLVVDDDYDIASLIKIGLEKIGLSVSSFTDPSLALEEFSKKPSDYELVISDIRTPSMNGYEFVKQVKKINPKVNVILMTAFEIEDKEFHSILPSIKINGFLQKPFSITQLNDAIRKIRWKPDYDNANFDCNLPSIMIIIVFCPALIWQSKMTQYPINFHVNDALSQINQAEYGAHYLIIYSDLFTLRELYSNYIQKQIEENNEMILINPFYETTDSVRQFLSKKGVNVSKYEKEKVLVIIDSLKEYFGQQPNILFMKSLAKYAKQMGKNCLSVLGDLGAYPHKSKYNDLVDYELSLPSKYDIDMKGFCLYHQKDFDKFSDEQKEKLIEHHGKALKIERS